jgi:spore coat polysaccharide biosynthesis predicted glycosyltransferase SpsG
VFVGEHEGLAAWLLNSSRIAVQPPSGHRCAGIPEGFDAAIVDSYSLPVESLCRLARRAPLATLAEARRCPTAGVLIDYHLDRAHLRPRARLLPGPLFAPIDPVFAASRRPAGDEPRGWPRTALVTTGGSSAGRALAADAVDAIREVLPGTRIRLASGPAPAVELDGGDIEPLPFPSRLSEILGEVDLAVSAAGHTAYELACAGVPSVLVAIAPNQRRVAAGCAAAGVALSIDPTGGTPVEVALKTALRAVREPARRRRLAARGMSLFDGRGAERIAQGLLERWKHWPK